MYRPTKTKEQKCERLNAAAAGASLRISMWQRDVLASSATTGYGQVWPSLAEFGRVRPSTAG